MTCVRQGCTGGSRRLRFVLPRYYYRPFQACCQGVFQSSRQREASPPGSNTETGFLYTPLLEIQKCTSIEKTQCLCGFPLLSGCTSIPHSCTLSSILVHLYNNENPSVYAGLRYCCTLSHLKPRSASAVSSRLGAAACAALDQTEPSRPRRWFSRDLPALAEGERAAWPVRPRTGPSRASEVTSRTLPARQCARPATCSVRARTRPATDYGLKERFRSTLPEMPGTVPLAEYCQIWKS